MAFRPDAKFISDNRHRMTQVGGEPANDTEPEKRNKYGNKKTRGYDSAKEAKRAGELKFMELAGDISDLQEQPEYLLIPSQDGERPAYYTPDFQYIKDGLLVVEDVKSKATKTEAYVLRRKLLLFFYGIKVIEI